MSVVVTGSSGFIGSHLCARLARAGLNGALGGLDILTAPAGMPCPAVVADINSADAIRHAIPGGAETVLHLAAKAEVVIPFDELPDLNSTNVTGTINILTALSPRTLLFASSSAVYGNGPRPDVDTSWSHVNPVGAYGMTKAAAELACGDWARQTGGSVVSFRLGNVIGARCRGLIPYLTRHARRYPDGAIPVRMRGNGQIVRDYVPVDYVVEIFHRASRMTWRPGEARAFNIGTGRGMTNLEVAHIVRDLLRTRGYELRIDPSLPLEPGEADHVVLAMDETARTFELPVPDEDAVREAIAAAVAAALDGD